MVAQSRVRGSCFASLTQFGSEQAADPDAAFPRLPSVNSRIGIRRDPPITITTSQPVHERKVHRATTVYVGRLRSLQARRM